MALDANATSISPAAAFEHSQSPARVPNRRLRDDPDPRSGRNAHIEFAARLRGAQCVVHVGQRMKVARD
jgi:hypothetical protein